MDDFNALVQIPDGFAIVGCKHSTGYMKIKSGLLPPPVSTGPNSRRLLRGEMMQVRDALIAGKTEDEIRQLVRQQVEARKHPGVAA